MKPKFEIGDRVRYNELEGVIVGIDAESKRYSIQYEDDDDKYCVKEDWIEFANPRAAFLTRLQELLATFDASIEAAGEGTDSATIDIYFNDKQLIYSEDWNDNEFICKITAENIVNYDKDRTNPRI